MPAFSVDSELLRYFTGHADAFKCVLSVQLFCGLPGFLFEPLTSSQCTDKLATYNIVLVFIK